MKKEILIDRLEVQIEQMFDTLIAIEKYEQDKPMREVSDWHKIALWMIFSSQILCKICYNTILNDSRITIDQKCKYIEEVWEVTREHFLNLYWFDTLKISNNIK